MVKWDTDNSTGLLFNPDTSTTYPHATEHWEWFASHAGKNNTFLEFYIPAWIILIVGWLLYWALSLNYVSSPLLRYPDGDSADNKLWQYIGISRSSASLFLAVMYAIVGITVHILNGDKSVNAFSIIALFLAAGVFRFFRQTHKKGNVLSMVANLLFIIGVTLIAMAYANVHDLGDNKGHKMLYWIGGAVLLAAGLWESGTLMMNNLSTGDLQDDTAYVVYKFDYAFALVFIGAFGLLELVLISQHEYKHYAWPLIFIYVWLAVTFIRIAIASFGLSEISYGGRTLARSRTKSTTKTPWTVFFWNALIVLFALATVMFAHVNLCSSFPKHKSQEMQMCHGFRHVGDGRSFRVLGFSLFSQLTLLMFWIGFMNSGLKDNGKLAGAMMATKV